MPLSLKTKLAATMLALRNPRGQLLIPYRDAKRMHEDQIISLFQFDHCPIPKASGGSDHPSNLVPLLISEHREKTRTRDLPQIAKDKRIASKHQEHLQRMRSKYEPLP